MDTTINTTYDAVYDVTNKPSRLNIAARIRRVMVGGALIGVVMGVNGPLGYLTLLALLAIYPILTGLIGEDPLDGLLTHWEGGYEGHCLRSSTRVGLLLLGGVAISVLMVSPESAGLRAMLGITALYPILAGLFGEDLLSQALGMGGKREEARQISLSKVAQTSKRVVTRPMVPARLHWFGHGSGSKAA
ncbi:MAG TPA: hypothetical protein ENI97_07885 [Gammaproteobacteria bacterium]|nr:hypothetical protein [Gammaproteobacteria bacterium]